jgi:E3 ubiquitin-protein ligase HECTD1
MYSRLSGSARLEAGGADRFHRQVIDAVRNKDMGTLIEAIELLGFDVNFMDDVGQTLLNWASAFGTIEMASQDNTTHTHTHTGLLCFVESLLV